MSTEQERNLVHCRSVNSIRTLQNTICSSVDNVISNNTFWSEEEKERVRNRFQEVFTSTIQDNIVVDGKTWAAATNDADDDETTSEMEPLDPEKMKELNEVVYPAFNAQMMETTRERQHCPHKCVRHFAKQCRAECYSCDKVKVDNKQDALVTQEPAEDLDTSPALITSAETTKQLMKVITNMQEDTNELMTVLRDITT